MLKYRKSNRLPDYDYSQDGYYFVTICTKNKEEHFGKIKDGKMILSKIGVIADRCWIEIPMHFPNVKLDEYIIMPDHIHGIVVIEGCDDMDMVGNRHACSLQERRQYQKLPIMIGSFKSAVTKLCKRSDCDLVWQRSFYDHVIRNERSLLDIREYIQNNPIKWELERKNPENLFM
jgi:REP element-mobilizing transposase RayT